MSVKETTKKVWRCICELPDCIGKGKPWLSKDDKIPKRCSWCKKHGWNGEDNRTKDGVSLNIIDPDKKRRERRRKQKAAA